MESLKDLSSDDLTKVNGGIVWVPIAIKAAKIIGGAAAAYIGYEVTDGVVRGVAGGDYVPCE